MKNLVIVIIGMMLLWGMTGCLGHDAYYYGGGRYYSGSVPYYYTYPETIYGYSPWGYYDHQRYSGYYPYLFYSPYPGYYPRDYRLPKAKYRSHHRSHHDTHEAYRKSQDHRPGKRHGDRNPALLTDSAKGRPWISQKIELRQRLAPQKPKRQEPVRELSRRTTPQRDNRHPVVVGQHPTRSRLDQGVVIEYLPPHNQAQSPQRSREVAGPTIQQRTPHRTLHSPPTTQRHQSQPRIEMRRVDRAPQFRPRSDRDERRFQGNRNIRQHDRGGKHGVICFGGRC